MYDDPLLSVFPPPLLTRILCGGEGLQAAWGPLLSRSGVYMPWDPGHRSAIDELYMVVRRPLKEPSDYWLLPLDHWRARLALVAAWMLGWETPACYIQPETEDMHLSLMCMSDDPQDPRVISPGWDTAGRYQHDDLYGPTPSLYRPPNLPTLPAHLLTHDPAVALVLALYDVPEIKERLR